MDETLNTPICERNYDPIVNVAEHNAEVKKAVRGYKGGCAGGCGAGFRDSYGDYQQADVMVNGYQKGAKSSDLIWPSITVSPQVMKVVFFTTLLGLSSGITRHRIIKPKDSGPCSNITTQCPLPGSWTESVFMRKHCYSCDGGMAYCTQDSITNKTYYICLTEDEMNCEAGYYGRFTLIEPQQNEIQFEKLMCLAGTHAKNRRDCRRTCEDNDSINESVFTVLTPQQFDGTPARLKCNQHKNLCPINSEYGEEFPNSRQLQYHDVCGVIGKDCLSAKLEPSIKERKVESIPPEDIATSPASVTPDTTLAPDTNQTADTKSVPGSRSVTTTKENTPLHTQEPPNLGTSVAKTPDGSNGHTKDPALYVLLAVILIGVLGVIAGLIGLNLWKKKCRKDEEQLKEFEQGPEQNENREDKVSTGTAPTINNHGVVNIFEHVGNMEVNRAAPSNKTEADHTDDELATDELSMLLNGEHLGTTSPVFASSSDGNSTASTSSTPTSTNADFIV